MTTPGLREALRNSARVHHLHAHSGPFESCSRVSCQDARAALDEQRREEEGREALAWTLRGVGMYGSDVEVVSLEAYQRLAQRCRNAEAAALVWGRKCIQLEGERGPAPLVDDDVLRAVRLPLAALADREEGRVDE